MRAASNAVSVDAHVALGGGELRLGLLQFLERGGLAFIEIADALLDDLRQIELGARLVSGGLRGDEFVLRRHLLRAVDFQQRIALLTWSPTLAIRRVTRPENGVRTIVLASSLNAI